MKQILLIFSAIFIALQMQAGAPAKPTHNRQVQHFVFDTNNIVSFTPAALKVVVEPAQKQARESEELVIGIPSPQVNIAAEPLLSPAKTKSFAATPKPALLPGITAHKSIKTSRSCSELKRASELKATDEKKKSEKQTFVSPYAIPNPPFKKWEPKPRVTKDKNPLGQYYKDGKNPGVAFCLASLNSNISKKNSFGRVKAELLKNDVANLEAIAKHEGITVEFRYPCRSAKNLAAYAYDIGLALNIKGISCNQVGKVKILLDAITRCA
jgi:hypothetical protein